MEWKVCNRACRRSLVVVCSHRHLPSAVLGALDRSRQSQVEFHRRLCGCHWVPAVIFEVSGGFELPEIRVPRRQFTSPGATFSDARQPLSPEIAVHGVSAT